MLYPHRNFNFHPKMQYYPIGLNGQVERGYFLWQTYYNCGKFIVDLKQTKGLCERPCEIDDFNILVLKFAEGRQSNTKQMVPAIETNPNKVKSKKKNV